jgi:hypothetical protein
MFSKLSKSIGFDMNVIAFLKEFAALGLLGLALYVGLVVA